MVLSSLFQRFGWCQSVWGPFLSALLRGLCGPSPLPDRSAVLPQLKSLNPFCNLAEAPALTEEAVSAHSVRLRVRSNLVGRARKTFWVLRRL